MNQRIPCSTKPINGELRIQNKKRLDSSWEFCVWRKAEYAKLPNDYPKTVGVCPSGILVTLIHKKSNSKVSAAFHGGDKGFCIGSARNLRGSAETALYRNFLRNFGVNVGVHTRPIPVKLDFRDGNIVCAW